MKIKDIKTPVDYAELSACLDLVYLIKEVSPRWKRLGFSSEKEMERWEALYHESGRKSKGYMD